MKIYKLKIVKITQYCLIVEDITKNKGTIHISQISNSFIKSLEKMFKIDDIVFGTQIKDFRDVKCFSLKEGHKSAKLKIVSENGGGFLGLKYTLERLEKKYDENK